jgi:hypothetical protein
MNRRPKALERFLRALKDERLRPLRIDLHEGEMVRLWIDARFGQNIVQAPRAD